MNRAGAAAEAFENPSGLAKGPRIAVVGTGVAALMCVRSLAKKARSDSTLKATRISFCTSRGKMCTQMGPRNQTPPQPGKPFFDYGCQYFTADNAWFAEEVERWGALGYVQALEEGRIGMLSERDGFQCLQGAKCWVGNGGMGPMLSNLIEQTAKEFEDIVEYVPGFPNESMKVVGIAKAEETWGLLLKGGQKLGPFDVVIGAFAQHCLTDPFLLSGGSPCENMLKCLRRVESNQLIPLQVMLDDKPVPAAFCAAHVYGEKALGFISNNSNKPQQNGVVGTPGPTHWTLISSAEFAEYHFNANPKGYKRVAEQELLAAFGRVLGVNVADYRPQVNRLNHWEDGLPVTTPPNSRGCLFDAENGIGWCGDFCVLPGVQGAALSGLAMADIITKFLTQVPNTRFDTSNLLPADVPWTFFSEMKNHDATLMDIGAFSSSLGLIKMFTHGNLVPSAIDGYNVAAHTGGFHSGKGKGKKADIRDSVQNKVKGKGKNSSKGKFRSYW